MSMKLLFKQRVFSWFDSYDIYDEEGNNVFTVKGDIILGPLPSHYEQCGGAYCHCKRSCSHLPAQI